MPTNWAGVFRPRGVGWRSTSKAEPLSSTCHRAENPEAHLKYVDE
jgi:hypothetical protein